MEDIALNRSQLISGDGATSQFRFMLLKQITNNFSEDRIIGCGAYGVVYKGVLDNGEEIAVKKLIYKPPDHDSEKQFHDECTNLMGLQHQNIVRLVGYCCETSLQCVELGGMHDFADENERALCFEYLSGGSLDKHVSDEPCRLDWDTCYKIIKGVCEGLNHLHNGYRDSIFHLNLKPTNILLDNNMIPKIGGFGLSRLFPTTKTCTTKTPLRRMRYTPPEFVVKQEISYHCDVFSLGMVIIHIMAGRKHYCDHADTPSKIIELVCENWGKRLHATMWSHALQEIKTCIEIALRCVRSDRQERPTISNIVDDLNRIAVARLPPTYERDLMEAPVCALVDAMFRLPGKLDALLVLHGHMLPWGAADEISLIKQDLDKMLAILQEHDESGAQDHAMMVKCLTKEVRELSYDMEDSIDQYEHFAGTRRWTLSPRHRRYKITRHRGKTAWRPPEKLKWRLWIANKIREFSVRSQEALQRYSLFNHLGGNGISSSTGSTFTRRSPFFGSWHPTPYGELVGNSAPLKKLEAWLDKDGEQKLKVVSVIGPGGVGKTTLASELYRRLGGKFECLAFVRTSRKPDVRRLLISMLSQVRPHQTPQTWKVHSLIADIRTHLQDKRYLIVIDEIWDIQTWDIISRALPDGNLCSGILITTEVEYVSLKCCGFDSKYVFTMKSLGHDNSSKLFFNTLFGTKYQCPPEFSEVANNIITKCAGLPLAVVTVASLLVRWMGKPEQWDYVNKSLGYGLRTTPTLEGMKQVLNLSYNNLPQHLKACVMYLSIYQEDDIILKDDLVRQWIAEGFICATEDKDSEEISRSYFDDLISSRMIQPVHINDNDDALSCMVHYMVLDFIRHKSIEENFVTAIDHCQTTARLADKVRRLSLHFGNAEATPPTNLRLSQVRTLAFFGVLKCLPSVVEFRLLQVLILQLWGDDDHESISFDLTRISELFRLRYLHIKCNVTLNVQKIQMRALQCLETLKIEASIRAVPSDIAHLSGLLHLSLPIEENFPNGIGNMTSLCTLGYFDLSVNSTENVQSLVELTNLQDLRLTCSTVLPCHLESKMESMGSILAKLSNLRSLTLESSTNPDAGSSSMPSFCDGLSIVSSAPEFLRRFEWLPHICTFSSLRQWIRHLDKLCILKIGVTELVMNDVYVLRGLPALTVLSLYVRTKPAEKIVFKKTGFSALKYFKFTCSVPWVEFEMDAMPNLRKLKLGFDAHGADQHNTIPVGIEHLSGLKEISAKVGGASADDPDRTAAELALNYAINMHPARPTFNIRRVHWVFTRTGRDDYNSNSQEEEHMTLEKQYEVMDEVSNEQDQILQNKDFMEDSNKNVHGRKILPKRSMQMRLSSLQDIEELDDGFSWMKYGQKDILGSMYPRSYYRCKHRFTQGCQAMKQLQRTDGDPLLFDAMYVGNHICTQVANSLSRFGHEQSSVSGEVKAEMSAQGTEHIPRRTRKLSTQMSRRMQVRVESVVQSYPLGDDFSWRKYGEKDILGSKYPRGYFRCTHRYSKGCAATKHVQRNDNDPLLFDIMYNGEHTCAQNAHSELHLGESISAGSKEPPATSESQITYGEISGSTAGAPFRSLAMSISQFISEVKSGSGRTAGVRFMTPGTSNSQITSEAASGSGSGSTAQFWSGALDEVDSIRDDMLDPDCDDFN